MTPRRLLGLLAAFATLPISSSAVSLHGLFTDHAVLQADRPVPIHGSGADGEHVVVRLGALSAETVVRDGRWRVDLPVQEAGGPHTLIVVGKNTLELRDLWFGDVWVAGGQSNMLWSLQRSRNAQAHIAAADDPLIRFFVVPPTVADHPQTEIKGRWLTAAPDSVAGFSAVAYHFAREMRRHAPNRPVGVVQAAVGGTILACWRSEAALATDPDTPAYRRQHAEALASHDQRLAAAQAAGRDRVPPPERILPAGYYNGMIAPLAPLSPAGVIWYQGEGNTRNPDAYAREFGGLIAEWRALWRRPDLPFIFVQLAGFDNGPVVRETWPRLREAQRLTWLAIPRTGMAVAIDVGEARNIHPGDKQPVGERLSRWARVLVHGETITPSGPSFRSATAEGDTLRLRFNHAPGGLATTDGAPTAAGFEIAGDDRVYHPAEARIDGETLLVRAPAVPAPRHARYAWTGLPAVNLVNRDGLPAVPFRTENLPSPASP